MKIFKTPTYFDCAAVAAETVKSLPDSLDTKITVFCEDKFSLSLEQAIAEKNGGGTFNTNVYSFSRYIKKHGNSRQGLSKQGSAAAIKKILIEKNAEMECFKNTGSPNLPVVLYELIAQLKSAKVSPETLKNSILDTEGALRGKLADIYTVYNAYEKFLKENNLSDSNNYLGEMVDLVGSDEDLTDSYVIFAGYASVTRQSAEIMKTLVKKARDTYFITVCGDNEEIYTNEFLEFAQSIDKNAEIITSGSLLSAEAEFLENNLYNPSIFGKAGNPSGKISVYEAKNIYEEVNYLCARIRFEVIENHERYKDIVVAAGNLSEYGNVLEKAFSEYDIPYFIDKGKALSEHPIIRLVCDFIDASIKNLLQDNVLKLTGNSVLVSDKKTADEFDKYVIENSVNGKKFREPFVGVSPEAEDLRARIISLTDRIEKKSAAVKYIGVIKNILSDIHAEETLTALSDKLAFLGETAESDFNSQAYEKFISLLDEISSVMKDSPITAKDLKSVIQSGAASIEISLIPEFDDAVFAGELKNCRFKQADILFAAGLSGDVPFSKSDTAILTDSDLYKLDGLNVIVDPKINVVNRREKQSVCVALLSFRKKLFASYSLTGLNGKSQAKSEIIEYILRIFGAEKGKLPILNKDIIEVNKKYAESDKQDRINAFFYIAVKPALERFALVSDLYKNCGTEDYTSASSFYNALYAFNDNAAVNAADSLLKNVNYSVKPYLPDKTNVYFKNGQISASVLETYFSCPYKAFLKYGAGLTEETTGDIQVNELGNLLHFVMEKYVTDLNKVNGKDSSDILASEIVDAALSDPAYGRYLTKNSNEYAFELIREEAKRVCYNLYNEAVNSDFTNIGTEVEFSDAAKYKALSLTGENGIYKIFGRADRIDRYKNYIRIIDYKTGTVKDKDEYFYTGNKLQLYLYMNAFIGKDEKPAGAYYYDVKNNFAANDDFYALKGKTLNSKEIFDATDKNLSTNRTSSVIKASVADTKEGEKYKVAGAVDEETLDAYLTYGKLIAEKGIEEIEKGIIAASPYEKACEYCGFKGICGYDGEAETSERKVNDITPDLFRQIAEKEKNNG